MNAYTVNGTTDERDACDCCGKSGLKITVCLTDNESGELVWFGTTCAAKAMKITVKEVRERVSAAEAVKAEERRVARDKERRESQARWEAHLIAKVGRVITDWQGKLSVIEMIKACGGYDQAREGFGA